MSKMVGFRVLPEVLPVISGLNNCASALILWMAENMDGENLYFMNIHNKRLFSALRNNHKPWSIRTADNALQDLKAVDFIRSIHHGMFFVNPSLFCKTTDEIQRDILIASYNKLK